jgi:TRAP-type C4-dicarboxylate transport system permease small subunit
MSGFFRLTPMRDRGPLRPLAWVIAAFDVAACWSLVGLISLMVLVVSAQVVLRYLFNNSLDWADEVARLCFVWSIFIAIPLGLKSGAHIGIEMLVVRFAPWLRKALARAVALVGAALLLLVAWESVVIAWDQWDELLSSVSASAAWFIVPLAFCGVHGALHLIWQSLTGAVHVDPYAQAEAA